MWCYFRRNDAWIQQHKFTLSAAMAAAFICRRNDARSLPMRALYNKFLHLFAIHHAPSLCKSDCLVVNPRPGSTNQQYQRIRHDCDLTGDINESQVHEMYVVTS